MYNSLPDHLTLLPGDFTLVICNECSLIFQNPRPTAEELAPFYPDDYESFLTVTAATQSALQKWSLDYGLRQRAKPILNQLSQERVLDIGSATGQFLNYLKEHSQLKLYGIEINPTAAQFAKEQFGLTIHTGDLNSVQYPDAYFHAITMWDVLEHLPDPDRSLQEIRRILHPDGFLLFRVPTIDSLDARLFGRYWAGLDMPRHLYIYSQHTLFRLLEESGFQPVRSWGASGNFFTFLLSLQFWLTAKFGNRRAIAVFLKLLRSMPIRLITAPYFYLINQLRLGPQITVLATVANDRN